MILFAITLNMEAVLAKHICFQIIRFQIPCEKRIFLSVVEFMPFLFGRIAYSILATFDPETYSRSTSGTIFRAIVGILIEVIVMGIYVAIGLLDVLF
jgi:hypothetical protein